MERSDYSSEITRVPEEYFKPDCPELGDVEEFLYGTTYYAGDGRPLLKPCYVYTPFGYDPEDEETRYDVIYFMHGFLMNANAMFEGDGGAIGNLCDWLIYEKKTRPFIAVAVTWDYENEVRDFDASFAQILQFHQEFRQDLVPAVEAKYKTFARSTDAKGLRESRDHRAFAGYSMGAVTAWQIFLLCADLVRLYAPLAIMAKPSADGRAIEIWGVNDTDRSVAADAAEGDRGNAGLRAEGVPPRAGRLFPLLRRRRQRPDRAADDPAALRDVETRPL